MKPPHRIYRDLNHANAHRRHRLAARTHLRSAGLAGAATGMRATVGTGALINVRASGLPALLTGPGAALIARLAVTGELVADKLPSTPSRLIPRGLASRFAFAAFAGALIARGADQPLAPAAFIASAAALVSARISHDVRAAASGRFPPCAVAAAEDGIALALAGAAGEHAR